MAGFVLGAAVVVVVGFVLIKNGVTLESLKTKLGKLFKKN